MSVPLISVCTFDPSFAINCDQLRHDDVHLILVTAKVKDQQKNINEIHSILDRASLYAGTIHISTGRSMFNNITNEFLPKLLDKSVNLNFLFKN